MFALACQGSRTHDTSDDAPMPHLTSRPDAPANRPRVTLALPPLCYAVLAALAAGGIFAPAARAAGPIPPAVPITVTLASGRQFRGLVDTRTTGSQLWLRCGNATAHILRPVEWGRLVRAEAGGNHWTAAEFKQAILSNDPFSDERRADPAGAGPTPALPTSTPAVERPHPSDVPAPAGPIQAFDVAAELGHWSQGTEADGLLVSIAPKDSSGALAAVDGTLELNLQGQRFVPLLADANQFPELARWTQRVAAADFANGTATYRLPFQALHPDFNVDLGSLGLVHARLTVPGQGVFEATTGPTAIRQFNPVRNRRQEQLGGRFWSDERTDRGKTTPPAYFWAQPGTY